MSGTVAAERGTLSEVLTQEYDKAYAVNSSDFYLEVENMYGDIR